MQKGTDQAPNLPTYQELFGEDTSDEDGVEHGREQSGTDGKKRKIRRVRLTEKQKIEIAIHSQKNPLLNQKDLIEWSHHEFSLEVSKAAMSKIFSVC